MFIELHYPDDEPIVFNSDQIKCIKPFKPVDPERILEKEKNVGSLVYILEEEEAVWIKEDYESVKSILQPKTLNRPKTKLV